MTSKGSLPPPPPPSRQYLNVRWLFVFGVLSLLLIGVLYLYITLQSSYQDLSNEYSTLSSEFDGLRSSYDQLHTNYTSLKQSYSLLNNNYQSLQTSYSNLQSSYSSLSQEKANIETWYASIRDQINLRHGLEENHKKFVTPDDPKVSNLVIQTTGGWSDTADWNEYWSDLRKMYDWVIYNVEYSHDSPLPLMPEMKGSLQWRSEFWRFPNDTIADKNGDCEDLAVLLCSMIINYNKNKYAAWAITYQSESTSHVAVAFPVVGGRLTILDPAGKFYTSDLFGNLASKDTRTAVNEWLQYWDGLGQRNIRITLIFNQTIYKEFSSTDEFIQWTSSYG